MSRRAPARDGRSVQKDIPSRRLCCINMVRALMEAIRIRCSSCLIGCGEFHSFTVRQECMALSKAVCKI